MILRNPFDTWEDYRQTFPPLFVRPPSSLDVGFSLQPGGLMNLGNNPGEEAGGLVWECKGALVIGTCFFCASVTVNAPHWL